MSSLCLHRAKLVPEHDEEAMASYSILGATGNCGSALLTLLLQTTDVRIKVYCRNKDKLFRLVSEVMYLDIAAGMIEAADDAEGRWDNKNVGVVNANGKAKFPPSTPRCIALGLSRYYFPFLHPYLPANAGPA